MEIEILDLKKQVEEMMLKIYPLGSIYMNVNPTNPGTLFGGEWVRWGNGRFPIAVDEDNETGYFEGPEKTGGSFRHTLTVNEMPSHTHIQNQHAHVGLRWGDESIDNAISLNGGGWKGYNLSYNSNLDGNTVNGIVTTSTTATNQYTGGGESFDITPPFITVYMWKRIA